MKKIIPNAITSLNLIFGVLSIMSTQAGDFFTAACCIVLAMVADGMDGRVARYFKVSGDFGKELDSLCDLASFGVAPAVLAYAVGLSTAGVLGKFACVMFAVCGALRLARFNVNTSVVKGFFMGLPIPAGGCLVATFVMMGVRLDETLFAFMVMVFGYLMVSQVRYPDFKGKGITLYVLPMVVSGAVAAAILYCNHAAVPFLVFFTYALFGILNTLYTLVKG